ncbi:MAG: triose-phosphate isomerase [Deltaproteobacteria bacterium]|nr:triose-phosphate isomerase [Deltaproteobacteria bacterium]
MRTPMIAGNWKLHKTKNEAFELIRTLSSATLEINDVEIVVAPVFTVLDAVAQMLNESNVKLAAQNCYPEPFGAFTGEVSAELLKDVGCDYVIIGHSERRKIFNETDLFINKKIHSVLDADLKAILCVGETLEERENGQMFAVLKNQLTIGLANLEHRLMDKIVIAYEPVWAIGTGRTASPQQAQEIHFFLRSLINDLFGPDVSEKTRLLYGGSVKPDNIDDLMAQPDLDGALVGGASLKSEDFLRIIKFKKSNSSFS